MKNFLIIGPRIDKGTIYEKRILVECSNFKSIKGFKYLVEIQSKNNLAFGKIFVFNQNNIKFNFGKETKSFIKKKFSKDKFIFK